MANTFNREIAKKVRTAQEDIKTDFCKYCEEKACDGCFIDGMTEAYTLRAEIALEQKKLDFVNHLLSMTGDEIYDKYGFKRDETIISTAVFPDGMQADIKIVICDGENKPYTEAVLFDKNGFQKAYTDPEDEYTGDWELEYDDVNYVVTVKVKEPVGYRSDGIFNDGYRNAVDVMTHEIFELWNADILDTLADSILKDTDIVEDVIHLSDDLQFSKTSYFADIFEEKDKSVAEEKKKAFVRRILDTVKEKTGKDIKYVLWLSDSVDDVIAEYELTIPAHTYVGVCAFSETDVTDVIIEDISKISERAFAECKPLKKLTINVPVSVAGLSVPGGLACECKSLKTVTFTGHIENLSSIKEAAFRGTMMLTEINLPDNIRLIEKEAFHGSGIESIHLPENLKQIGIRAFMSSDLKSITVPDKTVKLGKSTFEDCVHLTEATLPKSITTIPERVFINCVSLKTVNASNINVVCCGAFSNCVSLEAFDFSQVKELGSRSFSDSGLHEVVFSNKPPKLQLSVFCNCKNLQQVDMSACNKIETISAHCFANCSSLKDIKLPPNVHKFDDGCFTSVKLDKLVIKAGMRVNFHAFSETSINELEFIDDAGKSAKTVVDLYAFENAKVGRLIIPDHMYDRFKEVIAKMR